MPDSFALRVIVPGNVLVRELDGEAVVLNLNTGTYFGLDAVGTRMWAVCAAADSISDAYEALLAEYDVEPELLRQDLNAWLDELTDHGLLVITGG